MIHEEVNMLLQLLDNTTWI